MKNKTLLNIHTVKVGDIYQSNELGVVAKIISVNIVRNYCNGIPILRKKGSIFSGTQIGNMANTETVTWIKIS